MKQLTKYLLECLEACHLVRKRNAGGQDISNKLVVTTERYIPKYYLVYHHLTQKNEGAIDAKQESTGKRSNLLISKRFVLIIPLFLTISIGAFYYLHKPTPVESKHNEPVSSNKNNSAHEQSDLSIAPRG